MEHRDSKKLPNGRLLGEYIPFYFDSRMPMLYVVQKGYNQVSATLPENIVYCVSSISTILDLGLPFIFTDGHAVAELSSYYEMENITAISSLLDFDAIKAPFWKNENDLDLKRRKEAEFLVGADIPVEGILGWVVYNDSAKAQIEALLTDNKQVVVRPNFYF